MNEIPSPSQADPQPASPAQAEPFVAPHFNSPTPSRRDKRYFIHAALVLLALLLAVQWWTMRNELNSLRSVVAERLMSGDNANNETKTIARATQESAKELQAKVHVLENKQAEAQSQQLALEQLYQDLSKNRDDWALAEIEQVLSTASQQLQLAGNIQGALIALQNADKSLSRSDKPQFITVRRAIGRDLEKLKSLPSVNITGVALRLDSVISQIDGMPLLSDERPALPATQPKNSRHVPPKKSEPLAKAASSKANSGGDWLAAWQDKWDSLANETWVEIKQMIRVRNVESSDALLLSPTQAYYARENLKLRLLNARLALLTRNESAFRSDLIASQDAIAKYFDTRAKQTQTAQLLLKQVQGSNLAIEMPSLSDSLNAVRNYKAKP